MTCLSLAHDAYIDPDQYVCPAFVSTGVPSLINRVDTSLPRHLLRKCVRCCSFRVVDLCVSNIGAKSSDQRECWLLG